MEEFKHLKIKDWSFTEQPREKLLQKGINALSDAELLAILIGSGSVSESAVELARRILMDVNHNLNTLGRITIDHLLKYNGIGKVKAITILAALEIGRRRRFSLQEEEKIIQSSSSAFDIFFPILADLPHEEFWILLLNRSNRIILYHRISQGGISGTITDIRLILKIALEKLSTSIILCHNHPSGNLTPSDADVQITKRIKESSKLMDIQLIDHIIIGNNGYFSFADEGIL